MKHVLFVFVISLAIFAVGCQDSNSTGPVATSGHQLLKPSPSTGFAVLKGDVVVSSSGQVGSDQVFHIDGQASYEYKITGEGEAQVYEFTISTEAAVIPANPMLQRGSIADQSIYQISAASKQGVVHMQRDYYVPELDTKFHVLFGIAEDNSFSLESMWMDQLGVGSSKAKTN